MESSGIPALGSHSGMDELVVRVGSLWQECRHSLNPPLVGASATPAPGFASDLQIMCWVYRVLTCIVLTIFFFWKRMKLMENFYFLKFILKIRI